MRGPTLQNNAIFPESLTPLSAQQRLHRASERFQYLQLMILNGDSWFINALMYPADIIDDLNDLEQYRETEDQRREELIWRGGGRRNGRTTRSPRSDMLYWSMDRASKDYPEASAATLRTLFCSETRTMTALLNSKSTAQARQVINAAFVRANIRPPSTDASSSTSRHQQQQQQTGSAEEENVTNEGGAEAIPAATVTSPAEDGVEQTPTTAEPPQQQAQQPAQPVQQENSEVIYHSHHLPYIVDSLNRQIFITGQLLHGINSNMSQTRVLAAIEELKYMGQQQHLALIHVTSMLTNLETRMKEMERVQPMFHRLNVSPVSTPRLPEEQDQIMEDGEVQQHVNQHGEQQGEESAPSAPSAPSVPPQQHSSTDMQQEVNGDQEVGAVLTALQERSLRAQCTRVVEQRHALRPFRA